MVPSNSGPLGVSAKESVDFFGTVRGRIGYAMDRTLIYATGGFAYGEVNSRFDLTNGAATARLTRDRTDTGFAVGGGLEYALNPAWSFKVEYQYIDLGSEKATGTSSNGVFLTTNEIDTNFHTVRVGINYHIHDEYVPLK